MTRSAVLPFAIVGAFLTLGGCAYDDATGYAPEGYPAGYDSGMGSGLVVQPGDRFGGQNVASVEIFTQVLAPYGRWVSSRYGRAFRPDTPQGWRPYVNGRWGENRLWVSNDPWGWATDHYGRWGFDERVGWVWVPGTEWAPSWVAWREDPAQNVTGWAPVPPGVRYSLNTGFGGGFGYDDYASWYGPSWVWVPQTYLYQPGFGGRVLPWSYGADYWGGSRWQYQPGFGGRPNWPSGDGYHPQLGGWQGRPGYAQGQPPLGGYAQGRPPQNGFVPFQPSPGASWQEHSGGGHGGIPNADGGTGYDGSSGGASGLTRSPVERPTYVSRPPEPMPSQPQMPAPMPEAPRPQYVERPAPPPLPPPVQREERQEQVQAQSEQRNSEGNTRPD